MSESAEQEAPPLMLGGVLVETEVPRARQHTPTPRAVVVRDIQVPFLRIVIITTTWALASIPALLVLALVGGMVGDLLRTLSR